MRQRFDPVFPVDELTEHPDNPRRGDEDAIDESMAAHGFYGAVLVQESTGRIIAGNHRTRVARRRGDVTVPVLLVDVDDDQARRILLVDNRTSDLGGYDEFALGTLLEELEAGDGGVTGTGFDAADIAALLARWRTTGDPDEIPPPPPDPVSKRGDVWILGRHRLMCGDSTDPGDVARVMNGEHARLVATDPPFLVAYDAGNHPQSYTNTKNGKVQNKAHPAYIEGDGELYDRWLTAVLPHCTTDVVVYQWYATSKCRTIYDAWEAHGLLPHQEIAWIKSRPVLIRQHFMQAFEPCLYGWRRGQQPPVSRRPPNNTSNVWVFDNDDARVEHHPTAKPVELFTRPYSWHLRAKGLGFEPFSGSGTAIIAAELTGRRCYAMELSPPFVDVACTRFESTTGTRPVLEATGEPVSFAEVLGSRP